jgi:hypothetical protein
LLATRITTGMENSSKQSRYLMIKSINLPSQEASQPCQHVYPDYTQRTPYPHPSQHQQIFSSKPAVQIAHSQHPIPTSAAPTRRVPALVEEAANTPFHCQNQVVDFDHRMKRCVDQSHRMSQRLRRSGLDGDRERNLGMERGRNRRRIGWSCVYMLGSVS